jgi:hypothetical protein
MKKILLLFFSVFLFFSVYSQKKGGIEMLASAGVQMPLGYFSSTHSLGISIDFAPGFIVRKLLKNKGIVFTYNGGLTYYLGKGETVSGYQYKYPGYFFIHAFGGLLYGAGEKITASLLTGPSLGIYNGDTRFNIGGRLEGSYHIKGKFSTGPMINLMWEPGTNVLFAAGIKFTVDLY